MPAQQKQRHYRNLQLALVTATANAWHHMRIARWRRHAAEIGILVGGVRRRRQQATLSAFCYPVGHQ